jgi:hypothetical protein
MSIRAITFYEVGVITYLYQTAFLEHRDLVCAVNSVQPVGNNEHGTSSHQAL